MTTNSPPEALLKQIRSRQRVLISSHQNPDGDAIGSELGFARVMRAMGKGAVVWNRDETPALYNILPGADRIHVGEEPPAGFPGGFDAAVILECPSLERTGLAEAFGNLSIINIDHHLGNEHYGEVNWIDTAAAAVGAMVFELASTLKVQFDEETATLLLMTLVTDTGGFRFANANESAFESAAALVKQGAKPDQVSNWLYERRPEAAMRLLGELLQTMQLHHDGRLATAYLTQEMFTRAGAGESDTEGLIDFPRSIAGVSAVALIRQIGNKKFKVSLRSRGDIDVEKIARQNGGGGHRNAAGYAVEGTDPEALLPAVIELLGASLG